MRVEITDGVIPAAGIVAEIKAGSDGAVCVFDGIVFRSCPLPNPTEIPLRNRQNNPSAVERRERSCAFIAPNPRAAASSPDPMIGDAAAIATPVLPVSPSDRPRA